MILTFPSIAFSNGYSQGNNNIVSSLIKNESGLNVTPITVVRSENDYLGASYCSGTLFVWISDLNEIGITENKLKNPVMCTVGDFDANGYLDFAFWGIDTVSKTQNNRVSYDLENYLVIFFEGSKVIRKLKIKTEKYYPLVYYKPRLTMGKYGEPISNNDALWIWGENDGYDDYSKGIVYIYDNSSQEFKIIPFGKK